ncbi:hypothetical protein RA210_U140043 [Rubrivivax sp. A210]|nr:hypothetical protein RA210_U140043 [Rubrivivax sp. A210]
MGAWPCLDGAPTRNPTGDGGFADLAASSAVDETVDQSAKNRNARGMEVIVSSLGGDRSARRDLRWRYRACLSRCAGSGVRRGSHGICGRGNDRCEASSSGMSTAPEGRFEPTGPRRTSRALSAVARWQHEGQLANALLTFTAALASGLDVGLTMLTRLTPSGGGRLLTLQCRHQGGYRIRSGAH